MRMIVADDIADGFGTLPVAFLKGVAFFMHRIQDSPLYRLQTVSHIRDGPVLDDILAVPAKTVTDDILKLNLMYMISHSVHHFPPILHHLHYPKYYPALRG